MNLIKVYEKAILDAKHIMEEKNKEIDRLNNLNKQLVEECQRLDDEETRLNNIINELEKWLEEETRLSDEIPDTLEHSDYTDVLDKLKELKENK